MSVNSSSNASALLTSSSRSGRETSAWRAGLLVVREALAPTGLGVLALTDPAVAFRADVDRLGRATGVLVRIRFSSA